MGTESRPARRFIRRAAERRALGGRRRITRRQERLREINGNSVVPTIYAHGLVDGIPMTLPFAKTSYAVVANSLSMRSGFEMIADVRCASVARELARIGRADLVGKVESGELSLNCALFSANSRAAEFITDRATNKKPFRPGSSQYPETISSLTLSKPAPEG